MRPSGSEGAQRTSSQATCLSLPPHVTLAFDVADEVLDRAFADHAEFRLDVRWPRVSPAMSSGKTVSGFPNATSRSAMTSS